MCVCVRAAFVVGLKSWRWKTGQTVCITNRLLDHQIGSQQYIIQYTVNIKQHIYYIFPDHVDATSVIDFLPAYMCVCVCVWEFYQFTHTSISLALRKYTNTYDCYVFCCCCWVRVKKTNRITWCFYRWLTWSDRVCMRSFQYSCCWFNALCIIRNWLSICRRRCCCYCCCCYCFRLFICLFVHCTKRTSDMLTMCVCLCVCICVCAMFLHTLACSVRWYSQQYVLSIYAWKKRRKK